MTLLGSQWQAKHLSTEKMMSQIEEAAIATLLERTGGLPITIGHTATLILDPDINITQTVRHFMELFEKAFDGLPERPSASRDALVKALDTVWSVGILPIRYWCDQRLYCWDHSKPFLGLSVSALGALHVLLIPTAPEFSTTSLRS